MKKPILVVPRNAVREMVAGADADRLLASGSWCRVASTKPESANVRRERVYRRRREQRGCKRIDMWISREAFDSLLAKRLAGETMIATLERLLILPVCTCDKC